MIRHFVPLTEVTLLSPSESLPAEAAMAVNVVRTSRVGVPLVGLIDVAQEKQRLAKKQEGVVKELEKLEQLLGDENFRAKAPEALVVKNETRCQELVQQRDALNQQLALLG
jgi:valyl-tRNA synthetase